MAKCLSKSDIDYDSVGSDPNLSTQEIESGVYFNKSQDGVAVISSNDPNLVSRLMHSPFFTPQNYTIVEIRKKKVLVYVDGLIPVGAVSIGKPRKTNSTTRVVRAPVKKYTDAEKHENKRKIEERLFKTTEKGTKKKA